MRQRVTMLLLLGLVAAAAVGQKDLTASPPRLANGKLIEDPIKETSAEGLVFQTPKGLVMFPWKYLSAGTRYRHERPFLAAQEAARSNALQKAKAAAEAEAKKAAAKAKAKPAADAAK